jgi:hypothetical protein
MSKVDIQIEISDVLDNIDINEVINFFGEAEFLDRIGKEEAKSYFDLVEVNP